MTSTAAAGFFCHVQDVVVAVHVVAADAALLHTSVMVIGGAVVATVRSSMATKTSTNTDDRRCVLIGCSCGQGRGMRQGSGVVLERHVVVAVSAASTTSISVIVVVIGHATSYATDVQAFAPR